VVLWPKNGRKAWEFCFWVLTELRQLRSGGESLGLPWESPEAIHDTTVRRSETAAGKTGAAVWKKSTHSRPRPQTALTISLKSGDVARFFAII
jgi:hypothetical protein